MLASYGYAIVGERDSISHQVAQCPETASFRAQLSEPDRPWLCVIAELPLELQASAGGA